MERSAATPQRGVHGWNRLDWVRLGVLGCICLLWVHITLDWRSGPFEDAAMLLRYSKNFALGAGIRWNIGQHPVDGATDFLYMIVTGLLSQATHLDVVASSRLLALSSWAALVFIIYIGPRLLFQANPWVCAGLAAYFIVGPGVQLSGACFGASMFACGLCLAWLAANWFIERQTSWTSALAFALFSLCAGLTRPEGVVVTAFMLLPILYRCGWRSARRAWLSYFLVMVVLGGLYFSWHWRYFGYPLPNPYYVKGGGTLHLDGLKTSINAMVVMLGPLIALIPLGWTTEVSRRRTVTLLLVAVPFTLLWALLNSQNNWFYRFQYPGVPLVLLILPGMWAAAAEYLNLGELEARVPGSRTILRLAACLALTVSMIQLSRHHDERYPYRGDVSFGMRQFASRLLPFANRGYTMAVTEAGDLPLYSEWKAVDLFALNDATIAHAPNGVIPEGYLERVNPEIVMYHLWTANVSQPVLERIVSGENSIVVPVDKKDLFYVHVLVDLELVSSYVKTHNYTLAAIYGSEACDLHYYWVRSDLPDTQAILHQIRDYPYYFLDTGELSHDFRDSPVSMSHCGLARPLPK